MSTTQLINPATEEVLASVDHTDANAVDDAVQRARAAQRRWARLAPAQRAAGLRAFAAAVQAHLDELAALEVANSGHPIVSAEWEAGHVRDVLAFYAASPERLSGRQIPVAGGVDVTFNEPMGVVGVITPWNFPMVIASWAIAPALAAGNAVLVKPAELTPLTTMRLGELAVEAGLDEDLLQVLPGKARWSGSGSSPTPTFARSCSPGPPKSASGSWPVPRLKSNGDVGTGWQERQHRLPRLRPGARRDDRAGRGLRQRWAGLLCPKSNPGAAQRLRPVYGAARAGGTQHCRRGPRITRHRDGSAGIARTP